MKKLLRNSLLLGAAVLGVGSVGSVVDAATTTPTPVSSSATADITPGTISLSSAPSFSFGTVPASADDATYTSTSVTGDIALADAGSGAGYTVSVAASPFTATDGSSLKNAQLSLDNNVTTPVKAVDADNVSTPPTLIANLTLSNSPVNVLSAASGSGVGAYTASYADGDALLKVPAGNIGGSYSSTLTWTLSNAPTTAPTSSTTA
ncbi:MULTISPECIES: WxL domain-containing protein [unclassified Companilactobacillus]|uniref:WxL domain-containing protein n=1 Tax=unclassified Companilactobacillus TaxID=2767904 RepID=UPI002FF33D8D